MTISAQPHVKLTSTDRAALVALQALRQACLDKRDRLGLEEPDLIFSYLLWQLSRFTEDPTALMTHFISEGWRVSEADWARWEHRLASLYDVFKDEIEALHHLMQKAVVRWLRRPDRVRLSTEDGCTALWNYFQQRWLDTELTFFLRQHTR
jgi:hypothetical protein